MRDLYLIRRSDEAVYTYSPCGQGRWQLSRLSTQQLAKVKHVLLHGPKGWTVQDQSPGRRGGSSCVAVPVGGQSIGPQSGANADSPPLGLWQSTDGKCQYTLSETFAYHAPLESPILVEEPFVKAHFSEKGSKSRLEIKFTNKPITDESMERLLAKLSDVYANLARRPGTVMLLSCDLREAAVPSMRHVRRFMAFAQEKGDLVDLFIRGNAMILKPSGFVGAAVVNIIKMLQRILVAAWPEAIVPDEKEADKFLAQLSSALGCNEEKEDKVQEKVKHGLAEVRGEVNNLKADAKDLEGMAFEEVNNLKADAKEAINAAEHAAQHMIPNAIAEAKCIEASLVGNTKHKVDSIEASLVDGKHKVEGIEASLVDSAKHKAKSMEASLLDEAKHVKSSLGHAGSDMRRYVSRKRNNVTSHPDLVNLEVPVWVAMGYPSSRGQPGCKDSKVLDGESIMEDEPGPSWCGCSCQNKAQEQYSFHPQLQALFALAG